MAVLDWLQQLLGGGQAGEDTAAAGRTAAMQPGANVLGQNLLGAGQAVGGDIGDMLDAFWQGVVKAPGNALRGGQPLPPEMRSTGGVPSPVEQTLPMAMTMVGGGYRPAGSLGSGGFPIRAYHGSPYDFERFDPAKIGTGEGAQAYGHGLYFAENEGVARGYRDALTVPGSNHPLSDNSGTVPDWLANQIRQYPPGHEYYNSVIDNAKELFKGRIAEQDAQWKTQPWMAEANKKGLQEIIDNLGRLRSGDVTLAPLPKGHMYEVDINADPQRLLDWDKPLSGQPTVQRILADAGVVNPRSEFLETLARATSGTGGQVYESSRLVPGGYRDPQAASRRLNELGIPGIRYLDQGSRTAGQGTSNYVMFDPALITILRKYGIVPPVAGAGLLGAAEQQ